MELVQTGKEFPPVTQSGELQTRQGQVIRDSEGNVVTLQTFADSMLAISDQATARSNREINPVELNQNPLDEYLDNFDPKGATTIDQLDAIETASIQLMIDIAENRHPNADVLMNIFAYGLATARKEEERMAVEVLDFATENAQLLQQRAQALRQAWSEADDMGAAIRIASERFQELTGFDEPPQLIVWHDIDQNLTWTEVHNDPTPGPRYAKLAYGIHGVGQLSRPMFASFYGLMHQIPWARELFLDVGRGITRNGFALPGVAETLQYANEEGIEQRLITTNFGSVAEGVAEEHAISAQNVWGRSASRHASTNKPHVLMHEIARNPNTMHVIVDDGDGSLAKSIRDGQINLPGQEQSLPFGIHSQVFIIGRSQRSTDGKVFRIEQTLQDVRAPYAVHGDEYWSVKTILENYIFP